MKSLVAVLVGAAICGLLYGSYLYGRAEGSAFGYKSGYSQASSDKEAQINTLQSQVFNLNTQNNQLTQDYTTLYNQAVQAVGQAQAATYKPLRCTSYSYGIGSQFTSTNCY